MSHQTVSVDETRDFSLYNNKAPIDLQNARLDAASIQQKMKLKITPLANQLMVLIFDRDSNGKTALAGLSHSSCNSTLSIQNLTDLVVEQDRVILMGDQGTQVQVNLTDQNQVLLAKKIIDLANEILLGLPQAATVSGVPFQPQPPFVPGPVPGPVYPSLLPQVLAANEDMARNLDWLTNQNYGLGNELMTARQEIEALRKQIDNRMKEKEIDEASRKLMPLAQGFAKQIDMVGAMISKATELKQKAGLDEEADKKLFCVQLNQFVKNAEKRLENIYEENRKELQQSEDEARRQSLPNANATSSTVVDYDSSQPSPSQEGDAKIFKLIEEIKEGGSEISNDELVRYAADNRAPSPPVEEYNYDEQSPPSPVEEYNYDKQSPPSPVEEGQEVANE